MASVRLQPPESFDFKRPDEWPRWKKRFQQFRSASTLNRESEDRQVNTLLYCMGEEQRIYFHQLASATTTKRNTTNFVVFLFASFPTSLCL